MIQESTAKVLDWPALLSRRREAKADGKTVVWTNGCFDILHVGHVRNLQAARRLGDILVVGLNSDTSARGLKGTGRPIISELERAQLIAALACVDYVVIFGESEPTAAIDRLRPDIHCKGADYAPPGGKPIPEAAIIEAYGGRIEYLPMVPGISTSDLVRRIRTLNPED